MSRVLFTFAGMSLKHLQYICSTLYHNFYSNLKLPIYHMANILFDLSCRKY